MKEFFAKSQIVLLTQFRGGAQNDIVFQVRMPGRIDLGRLQDMGYERGLKRVLARSRPIRAGPKRAYPVSSSFERID